MKLVNVTDIAPSTYNPRVADPERLDLIELSLRKLGFLLPLYATPDGEIISGHQRHHVACRSGSLASVSELAVLNGANAALIGDELVQFQNAELIGERTYRLSRLLRGRQGTEWAVGSHTAGDRFILLSPALYTTAIANNLIGRELFYKAVSVGNSLGNTDEITFTYTGRNLKPFAPVHVAGLRDSSGNLTINWVRRSRVDAEWRDGVDIPLGEESERYEVEIMDGSTVVRTIATASPTASYSAAEQIADFGSLQSSVSVEVYQLSAVVGRGYAMETTV